jgi:hypothetical protein
LISSELSIATDWQRQQYLQKFFPWEHFSRRASGDHGPEQAALKGEERRALRKARPSGAVVQVTRRSPKGEWWRVQANGLEGWVYSAYLVVETNAGAVPCVTVSGGSC